MPMPQPADASALIAGTRPLSHIYSRDRDSGAIKLRGPPTPPMAARQQPTGRPWQHITQWSVFLIVMHLIVMLVWLGLCALQDLRQRRVSNWLTLGGAACALAYLLWNGTGWLGAGMIDTGIAATLALALSVPGYALGRLGGADVKLLLLLGLASTPQHLLLSIAAGGLFFCAWALLCRPLWSVLSDKWHERLIMLEPSKIKAWPFVPFLFVGFLTSIILTETFRYI